MVSITSGGGRFPSTRSVVTASDISWLALSAAISRITRRLRPPAVDRAVTSVSYAVFSAFRAACRAAALCPVPIERRSFASAWYTAATLRRSTERGDSSQPGTMSSSAQTTPITNSSAVCHHGRSAPTGPRHMEV
jgi:hypothetical protein